MMVDLLLRECSHQLIVYLLHTICKLLKMLLWSPNGTDVKLTDMYEQCKSYTNVDVIQTGLRSTDCSTQYDCVDGPTVSYRFISNNPLLYLLSNTDRSIYEVNKCSGFALFRQNIAMSISWFLHYTYNSKATDVQETSFTWWIEYMRKNQDCIGIGLLGPRASMLHTDKVLTSVSNTLCWHAVFHDVMGRFYNSTSIGPGYRYTSKSCNIRFKSKCLLGHFTGIYGLSRECNLPSLLYLYNNGDVCLDINKYAYAFYYASKCVDHCVTTEAFCNQYTLWITTLHR